ncbi:uncharacterized protein MELLADRAFT_94913 [Melampsora larici-populina 98AG31]|uniref:Uncharacterized protein n=1 Tax=Melampsora larici-populina (strain 98AG31 / pathotype 3-4-7) TaxID=747676 RepID=F4S8E1_MELLP|nr:uncharacterized protein MELLADRAFT_94913 [Melampsora larici-populina 98AG31]EGF99081.1 hypothetical protein MELLADRAFT_94913 [Melampsora larici-populina 98AG31]
MEDEIRALAAKRTKDAILSHCAYYDALQPLMGQHPNNLPLASAETPSPSSSIPPAASTSMAPTPSNTIHPNPLTSIDLTSGQIDETQSTQISGWDSTQSVNPHLESIEDFDLPDPNDLTDDQPSSNDMIAPNIQSQPLQRASSSQSQTPARNKVSSEASQTPKNSSRRSSGSAAVLKSMKSSLPSQTDFQEMNMNAKETNNTNRLMLQQTADTHNTVIGLLGAKFGLPSSSSKHSLEEEDANVLANKKAKRAKQDELDLIRLERELAAERRAFENEKSGSGSKMSPLELTREKVDMVAKLTLSHVPLEKAQQMVEEMLKDL